MLIPGLPERQDGDQIFPVLYFRSILKAGRKPEAYPGTSREARRQSEVHPKVINEVAIRFLHT